MKVTVEDIRCGCVGDWAILSQSNGNLILEHLVTCERRVIVDPTWKSAESAESAEGTRQFSNDDGPALWALTPFSLNHPALGPFLRYYFFGEHAEHSKLNELDAFNEDSNGE